MRRLYTSIFGKPCQLRDTDKEVKESREKVSQALKELDKEVITLMIEALREQA